VGRAHAGGGFRCAAGDAGGWLALQPDGKRHRKRGECERGQHIPAWQEPRIAHGVAEFPVAHRIGIAARCRPDHGRGARDRNKKNLVIVGSVHLGPPIEPDHCSTREIEFGRSRDFLRKIREALVTDKSRVVEAKAAKSCLEYGLDDQRWNAAPEHPRKRS